jgi:uncharacterized radical SAM superfamily Fe-S cluster-containing enzyme
MTEFAHSTTQSVCPECRQKVSARIVERQGEVFLDKWCATHGESSVLVSSDASWYRESVHHVKPRQVPLALQVENFQGCPESCGFCTEHRQHTCLPVIEILRDCDLRCPVCLKGEANDERMDLATFEKVLDTLLAAEGSLPVVNLSGGEPTLHPEIAEFLRVARQKGVAQVTVSTNGLRLLEDPMLRDVFAENGALVALQFDSMRDEDNRILRGRAMYQQRMALLEILEKEAIPYSFVATIARGVNEDQIADLAELLFTSKASTLMLQPVSLAGRAAEWDTSRRLTIPDVVAGLAKNQRLKREDFHPLPCSHPSCFAMSYFVETDDGIWKTLETFLGREGFLNLVTNRTLPGLDSEGFEALRLRMYELWSAADSADRSDRFLARLRDLLRRLPQVAGDQKALMAIGRSSMKAIFIHDFMDVHSMDIARLQKCCNPYARTDGTLVPMCAQNVFFGG